MQVKDQLIDAARRVATSENEQDIVEKLIVPLLGELGFGPDDFVPQQYVRLVKIGKGKTERDGYKPDHLIRLEGYYVAVVEVKKSSISVMEAWREAWEYAAHLNRNEPWSSAISVVVGCNGREIAIGTDKTADKDVTIRSIELALTHSQMTAELERALGKAALAQTAYEIRLARGRLDASSPRARLFHSSSIPKDRHNPIAAALKQVLDKYFVDLNQFKDGDFQAVFCDPATGSTRRDIEDVIRDRAPAGTHAERLTRNNIEAELGRIVRNFHGAVTTGQKPSSSETFVLILGDAGAGKSTLLDWYRRFSGDRSNFCFVKIDGTASPQEPSQFYEHVLRTACEEGEAFYRERVAGGDFAKTIRDICAPKATKERNELYSHLDRDKYYESHFPALAKELRQDKSQYLSLVLTALHSAQLAMCIFLDNLDQTNIARQVEGFRALRPFSLQFPVLSVMALREETYRSHENDEPFNAFHRSPVFHVPAPTAADVIDKRLKFVEQKYGNSDQVLAKYHSGQFTFEVSSRGAVRCLRKIADGLIASTGQLSLIDGICGHNIRKALDAFILVCTSSQIGEEALQALHQRFEDFSPAHDSIIRALVCGEWQYYCRESPMVANIFQVVQGDDGQSLLFPLYLLQEIHRHAADTHKAGKGYVDINTLREALRPRLYVNELALRRLLFDLHPTGIWQLDTLSPKDYRDFEFVRIQTPGLFLLWTLYKEPAYLDCMAFDTTIEDPAVLESIVTRIQSDQDSSVEFARYIRQVEKSEAARAIRRSLDPGEAARLFFPESKS